MVLVSLRRQQSFYSLLLLFNTFIAWTSVCALFVTGEFESQSTYRKTGHAGLHSYMLTTVTHMNQTVSGRNLVRVLPPAWPPFRSHIQVLCRA
jgi:hypothetical protein